MTLLKSAVISAVTTFTFLAYLKDEGVVKYVDDKAIYCLMFRFTFCPVIPFISPSPVDSIAANSRTSTSAERSTSPWKPATNYSYSPSHCGMQ